MNPVIVTLYVIGFAFTGFYFLGLAYVAIMIIRKFYKDYKDYKKTKTL